jgi:hypothetical protein
LATPTYTPTSSTTAANNRPTGVMILAGLEALVGLGFLGFGALMGMGGAALFGGTILGALAGMFGMVMVLLGLVAFVIAWGLWMGKDWALMVAMVFAVLGILAGLVTLPAGLFGLLINAGILYYLTRPGVKAWFEAMPG